MWRADAAWECAGWDQADLLSVLIVSAPDLPTPQSSLDKKNNIIMFYTAAGMSSVLLVLRLTALLLWASCDFGAPHTAHRVWYQGSLCLRSALSFFFIFVRSPLLSQLWLLPFLDVWHPCCSPVYLPSSKSVCDCHVMWTTEHILLMVKLFYKFDVYFLSLFCLFLSNFISAPFSSPYLLLSLS